MPKCTICGKKFDTLSALRDHHKSVHKNTPFVAPKVAGSRNFVLALVIVVVIVGAAVGYLIYQQQTSTVSAPTGDLALLNQPISPALYQNLTSVSASTLSSIGSGGVTLPGAISPTGQTLYSGGKPAVLYIGAEFCPYCAIERWAMVVALSKFGNFSNIEYMISAPDDGNVYTLTFLNANYSSKYISFLSFENEDRNHNLLQSPNSTETNIWNTYNLNSYPFIYFNGQYDIKAPQFDYTVLQNLNWTQIASQLNNPDSTVARNVDGAANTMISAICAMDGGNPSTVCGQSFAKLLSYHPSSQSNSFDLSFYQQITQLIGETFRVKASP
jgi:Domain of unknown function (DUF929)